jgi:EpsI family protein
VLSFLKSTPARIATLILVLQGALLYSVHSETIPQSRPLAEFPATVGSWQLREEGVVDEDTRTILNADDLLNRRYMDASANRGAWLFVAAFRSTRNGKTPHSPKNCLPGAGYTPLVNDQLPVDLGGGAPIVVNRYIVAHGEERDVVLYWYQSRERVVASEYKAKFWVMVDAVRLNRTDTALVRVVVPVGNRTEEQATQTAVDFVKAFFGPLHQYLPA